MGEMPAARTGEIDRRRAQGQDPADRRPPVCRRGRAVVCYPLANRVGRDALDVVHPVGHPTLPGDPMLLIREVMYCKPGKVRPLVEKFQAMSRLNEKAGLGRMRVMTDFCAERYWTIVSEFEVPNMQAFEEMMQGKGMSAEVMKEMEGLMSGYHELVESGRREIYKVEA
jgi:hypothetical protein